MSTVETSLFLDPFLNTTSNYNCVPELFPSRGCPWHIYINTPEGPGYIPISISARRPYYCIHVSVKAKTVAPINVYVVYNKI